MQGKKQRTQKLFLSFQLSERVPADNFYRRLTHSLDLHFLYKETAQYYGTEGQASIDPVVFFKLILVGYLENLNSDRKIIEHAKLRLDILYFIGYDLDEELPWHSTLSRTRQLYGEEVFRSLFKKVLKLCVSKGMVSGKRQALDSAFIKANASMDSIAEKEILEDGDAYSDELSENSEDNKKVIPLSQTNDPASATPAGTENNDPAKPSDPSQTVTARKHKEVTQHHAWKAKEYKDQPSNTNSKQTDEHGNLIRPKFLSNHTHYSTTDPDARISVKPGKPRQFNYSAQTSVDTASHVITNIMADYADKRDSQSLRQAVRQTKENLEESGLKLEELLADAAYSSGESLRYLEKENITGYIPNFGQYKPQRLGFVYNKEQDQYECQRGNKAILPLKKTAPNSSGYWVKVYRSSEKACKDCPFRKECIGEKTKFKKIDDSIHKPLYDRMHQRLQTAKAKRMKKLRSSTVEPVLGILINFGGMRRIWTRGIEGARKFMLGAAIAYNLKKWLNYKPRKVKVAVKTAEVPQKQLNNALDKLILFFLGYHSL